MLRETENTHEGIRLIVFGFNGAMCNYSVVLSCVYGSTKFRSANYVDFILVSSRYSLQVVATYLYICR